MASYSVTGEGTPAAGATLIYFVNPASTGRRLALYEAVIGCDATPAEQAAEWHIIRLTDENGTPGGTPLTPRLLDEDSPAAVSEGVLDPNNDPTQETDSIMEIGLHQKATYRWVAREGREFVCATTEDHGFELECESITSAFNTVVSMFYTE